MEKKDFAVEIYDPLILPKKEMAKLLSDAMFEDGMSTFLFPNPEKRRILLPKLMTTFINVALKQGSVEILQEVSTGKRVGAAVWFGPEDPYMHVKDFLLNMLHPSRVRIFLNWLPRIKNILDFGDIGEEGHNRVKSRHFYLTLLGLLPEYRRKGLGEILMHKKLEEAGELNIGMYLESCNPENLPFYERFGLRVIQQLSEQGRPVFTTLGLNVELEC